MNMDEESMKKASISAGHPCSTKSSVAVGLRILIQMSQCESNIVVKSRVRLNQRPTSPTPTLASTTSPLSCFLKSCCLCNKQLSPDKDIYMYRGDQGFCSVECRNRQIVLDEMKEMETSTKKIVSSFRNCSATSRRETRILEEEFRRRFKPLPRHKNRPIFL